MPAESDAVLRVSSALGSLKARRIIKGRDRSDVEEPVILRDTKSSPWLLTPDNAFVFRTQFSSSTLL
ncbi:hypothetical protein J6590_075470 [Homalodisca vitripennis]|nr:hypothetical protein J6590_075470 [Homalodisca vitripennis]